MTFQKGNHPRTEFEKGYKQTEEHKRKIGLANKGKIVGYKFSKGQKLRLGVKHTEETKQKMSISHIGKSLGMKGKISWNYIDGRSKLLAPGRYGDDWDKIRYLIYLRDRFTCQRCGIKGEGLDVHHKIPFLISLDNSLSNLTSLCRICHRKEESIIMKELKSQKIEV